MERPILPCASGLGGLLRPSVVALFLILVTFAPAPTHAGTFYVDVNNSAANDGGPGTEAVPFKTIRAALRYAGSPGNTILVKPGSYPEQVSIGARGIPGDTLVLRGLPGAVLEGARDASDPELWFPGPGSSWSIPDGGAPVQVDGQLIPSTSAAFDSMPIPSYRFGPAGLYVNLGGDNPGNHQVIFYGARSIAVILGATFVRLEGFEIAHFGSWAIDVRGGSDLVFRGIRVNHCGGYGFKITSARNITVEGSTIDHNLSHGISIAYSSHCTIQDNAFYNEPGMFGRVGLRLERTTECLIRRNRFHHHPDSGMELVEDSDNNKVTLNLSYANGDHGFGVNGSHSNFFDSNVAWGNAHDGMSLEGGATGCAIHNCILANNGIGLGHYDLFVADSSGLGLVSDDNIIWNDGPDPPIKFAGIKYGRVSDFSTATGHDTHTYQEDPRFVAPISGDFHLLSGSPAIDSGNSQGTQWPARDFEGHIRVDDPVSPNSGIGLIAYADRGAFEFVGPGSVGRVDPIGTEIALSLAIPNPTSSGVVFVITLPRPMAVRWEMLDVQGRRVEDRSAQLPAGRTTLRWMGATASGRPAPSGIYLMRVSAGGRTFTRTCAVMR